MIHTCLLFYFVHDKFDPEYNQCMTQLEMRSASAFLSNIVEYGYHSWTFKINKCDRGRGSGWSAMIGLW